MKECAQDSKEPASLHCPQLQLLVLCPWCYLNLSWQNWASSPTLLLLHYLKYLAMWPLGSLTILLSQDGESCICPLSHKLYCIVIFSGNAMSKCFILTAKSLPSPFMQALHTMEENTRPSQTPYAMRMWEKIKHTHTHILDIMAITEPEKKTS